MLTTATELTIVVVTLLMISSPGLGKVFGGLNNIAITSNMVKGEYHTSTGSIQFFSEVKGDNYTLTVTSASGNPILISRKPTGSNIMMMTMGNKRFAVHISQPSSKTSNYYAVSQDLQPFVESVFMQQNGMPDEFLQYLKSKNVKESFVKEAEKLALSQDAGLIVNAAKSLGSTTGVIGSENPAAMQFYVLAMHLDKTKDSINIQEQNEEINNLLDSRAQLQNSDMYLNNRWKRQGKHCWNCPSYFTSKFFESFRIVKGGCEDINNDECFGMCGRGCTCWKFLCGDCCTHQGCIDHDGCCRIGSKGYVGCYFPHKLIFFRCESHYQC